jgi:hypothetical protein
MTAPFRAAHGNRRSLADQSIEELGGRLSVLSRQKQDHIRLDRLLQQLRQAPPGEEGAVLLPIFRLVFTHAFAEETVLWPVIRRVVPDGGHFTLEVEREHQQINQLVTVLEGTPPGAPERARLIEQMIVLLFNDVRDEEDVLLPHLQEKLSRNQLRLLGVAWEAVRRISPTRPHPIVSRRPPGNVLAALPLSVLDRSRDRVDALLHRGSGRAAPALCALRNALGRASHAAERLPGLRQGEKPDTRLQGKASAPSLAVALTGVAMLVAGIAMVARHYRKAEPAR